jgi:hypothetical protein
MAYRLLWLQRYVGRCPYIMARPQVADGGDGFEVQSAAVNILYKIRRVCLVTKHTVLQVFLAKFEY